MVRIGTIAKKLCSDVKLHHGEPFFDAKMADDVWCGSRPPKKGYAVM
jgi:hypothetical protein